MPIRRTRRDSPAPGVRPIQRDTTPLSRDVLGCDRIALARDRAGLPDGPPINTGISTYEEYDSMELHLVGGERVFVDLRPLSVEQRGTLWQAIVRRAQLTQQG